MSPYIAQAAERAKLDISAFWHDGLYIVDAVTPKYLRREATTAAAATRAYVELRERMEAQR